jgi:hypothetical protein
MARYYGGSKKKSSAKKRKDSPGPKRRRVSLSEFSYDISDKVPEELFRSKVGDLANENIDSWNDTSQEIVLAGDDKMKRWKARFCDEQLLKVVDVGSERVKGTMVKLLVSSFDDIDFMKHYGTLYRWKMVSEEFLKSNEIGAANPDFDPSTMRFGENRSFKNDVTFLRNTLPLNGKMVLYLKDSSTRGGGSDTWFEWLYIGWKDVGKELGLFAARRFNPGNVIGPYVGYQWWRGMLGGKLPKLDTKTKLMVKGVARRGKDGYPYIVSPIISDDGGAPNTKLYMGFRFLSQALEGERKKTCNIKIGKEGFVSASMTIQKDQELVYEI